VKSWSQSWSQSDRISQNWTGRRRQRDIGNARIPGHFRTGWHQPELLASFSYFSEKDAHLPTADKPDF
jgi:hypothetical protein